MITWLPQLGYNASAKKLDDERLRRQVHGCLAIMDLLDASETDFFQHPEAAMWAGYERRFSIYCIAMVQEAVMRGMHFDTEPFHIWAKDWKEAGFKNEPPPWATEVEICRSHRSRLIQLDPSYAEVFPHTPINMPVLWAQPVNPAYEPRGYRLRCTLADIRRLNAGERQLPPHLYYNPDQNEILKRSEVA